MCINVRRYWHHFSGKYQHGRNILRSNKTVCCSKRGPPIATPVHTCLDRWLAQLPGMCLLASRTCTTAWIQDGSRDNSLLLEWTMFRSIAGLSQRRPSYRKVHRLKTTSVQSPPRCKRRHVSPEQPQSSHQHVQYSRAPHAIATTATMGHLNSCTSSLSNGKTSSNSNLEPHLCNLHTSKSYTCAE